MVDGGKRICAHDGCTNHIDDVVGRGRPRKYCEAHREPDRHREGYLSPSRHGECSVCGKSVATSKQSATNVVCHDCRAARMSEFVIEHGRYIPPSRRALCGECGVVMWSSVSAKAEAILRCKACRTSDNHPRRRCKCDECRAKNTERARKYRAKRVAEGRPLRRPSRARPNVPSCIGCGEPVFGSKIGSKYLPCHRECRSLVPDWKRRGNSEPPWFTAVKRKQERAAEGVSRNRPFIQGPCAWCGVQFLSSRGRYCSRSCAGAAGASRRGKFSVSPLVRAAIYERDRFLCHLCGRKVDVSLPGSNALGPTLDHVVPQAQGGTHDVDNLRLAHRKCNSIRRDLCVKDARAMLKRGVELAWLW